MRETGLVVIGTSLGGFRALATLLHGVPADFSAPIVVVQHRRAGSDDLLCALLQRYSPLPVTEPFDKSPIAPGAVYVAPADYHLLIEDGTFALTTESPVTYARPSIDVLFESAAHSYGRAVTAVVLTGSNRDGAVGAAAVLAEGGRVVVQDPSTAESDEMPRATIAAAPAAYVLALDAIAPYLVSSPRRTSHAWRPDA